MAKKNRYSIWGNFISAAPIILGAIYSYCRIGSVDFSIMAPVVISGYLATAVYFWFFAKKVSE